MDQGEIALNALLREREWKMSNCAVFTRLNLKKCFTRAARVARVSRHLSFQLLIAGGGLLVPRVAVQEPIPVLPR
jgi:hypothetical protein